MSETTFIKFLFREEWSSLKEVLNAYGQDYAGVLSISDDRELTKAMFESQPAIILASVKSKEDVARILGFLKTNRRILKESSVKFAAVNFTFNRQVETALMKIGCQEVLDPGVKGKALKYKFDMWRKALVGAQNKPGADAKLSVKEKTAEAKAAEAKADAIKWNDGLNCVDDMWLMRQKDHAKKILGKWLVKFMGPSPFVGQWTEATPGKKGIWKYTFKEQIRASFHKTDGNWFFIGDQKPEFIWKENLWMVTGSQFQLVFQSADEKSARFTAIPTQLTVCKNSTHAKAREAAIVETFDQEVMVKKGILADTATSVEGDQDAGGHYRGKTEGDEPVDQGPLEGKSSTDDLGGNLEGKVEGTDASNTDPYAGDSEGDSIDDVSDGKAGSDDLGTDKYKGKMEYGKDKRTTDWGGETDTDDLGSSHYSNKQSVEGSQAKAKQSKLSKDGVAEGEMSGELGTDDLGPAHYSNQKNRRPQEDKVPEGEMSGNIETDDLGPSHYGMKSEAEAAKKDKQHKLSRDAAAVGEMSGDIETDDLGPSHYSGKKSSEDPVKDKQHKLKKDAARDGEMSGDIETDDLGPAHYGGKATAEAAQQDKQHKLKKDAVAQGEMAGDIETEDLGKSHYGGKASSEALLKEKQHKLQKDSPPTGDLEGKAETESVAHEPHKADATKANPVSPKLAGDIGTDDLGPAHYSNSKPDESDDEQAPEPESQADFLRKQKEKKQRRIERNKAEAAALEAAAQAEALAREQERIEEEEEPSAERKVTSLLKEKLRLRTPAVKPDEDVEPQGPAGPIVTSNAVVRAVMHKKGSNVEVVVQLDDFFENQVIMRAESGKFATNDSVEISLSFDYMKKIKKIQIAGSCTESNPDGEGSNYLTVTVGDDDVKTLEQFMQLYRLRQTHIEEFLKQAKGH